MGVFLWYSVVSMKQYIKHVVHNRKHRKIAIVITVAILLMITFFSFRVQALDTTLEPTVCEGDWNVTEISSEKETTNEKSEEEVVAESDEDLSQEVGDIEEDMEEAVDDVSGAFEADKNPVTDTLESLKDLVKETPIFSFVSDRSGSVTCGGFALSDMPEKALPRSLKVVMTVSSPDGYEKDSSLVVEITQGVKEIFSNKPEDESSQESESVSEEENNDTRVDSGIEITEEQTSSPEENGETATEDVSDEQLNSSGEASSDTTEQSETSEDTTSSSSEGEPTAFFIRYAFAEEGEASEVQTESSSETEESSTAVSENTESIEGVNQAETSSSVSEENSLPEEGEDSIEVETSEDSLDNQVISVETGVDSEKAPIFFVEVTFDGGKTWTQAGSITLDMIPQEPTEVSVSVPINDPLFWMHVDQLQTRITRVQSGDSSDMEITIEHPHFKLNYDDAAVMPDFLANTILDIKVIGDLSVFVLEHKETEERTLWMFQSSGSSEWYQISDAGGVARTVPIGLKLFHLFWVTADEQTLVGFDTSSKTFFSTTIDKTTQMPFGPDDEFVVYKNHELSFTRLALEEKTQSDNDPTLVDLFIKQYVDVAREMEEALAATAALPSDPSDFEQTGVRSNSFVQELVTTAEDQDTTTVEGEVIMDLQEHPVEISSDTENTSISGEEVSDTEPSSITDTF